MEYIEGGELAKILYDSGKVPEHITMFIAAELILALEFLHT